MRYCIVMGVQIRRGVGQSQEGTHGGTLLPCEVRDALAEPGMVVASSSSCSPPWPRHGRAGRALYAPKQFRMELCYQKIVRRSRTLEWNRLNRPEVTLPEGEGRCRFALVLLYDGLTGWIAR